MQTWLRIGCLSENKNIFNNLKKDDRAVIYYKWTSANQFEGITYLNGVSYGRMLSLDGSCRILEGFFQRQKMTGIGRIIFENGSYYEGSVLRNQAHGIGIHYSRDGTIK
jgi:hypothetical protein